CFAVVVVHEWPDGKNKALKGSIRTPSVPRPISFYALAGRDPEPNTTIRKEEATWSRTSSCRCGSEQFIQKENFPEFTYRLFVLWNRVIYTKLLTHPKKTREKITATNVYVSSNLTIVRKFLTDLKIFNWKDAPIEHIEALFLPNDNPRRTKSQSYDNPKYIPDYIWD